MRELLREARAELGRSGVDPGDATRLARALLGDGASESWLGRVLARAEALRAGLDAALIARHRAEGFELG